MEGTEPLQCAHCPQEPQVKCYCLEAPISLCSACAVDHFRQDSSALHRPFPVDRPLLPSSDLCGVCKVSPAVSICTCMFPWISYCTNCADAHFKEEAETKHSLQPVKARNCLQNSEGVRGFQEKLQVIEEFESEVKRNLVTIADCIKQVNEMASQLIAAIEGWRETTVRGLLEAQERISQNVEISCKQLETLRYEASINPISRLEQLVVLSTKETCSTYKPELAMVKFTIEPDRLLNQIPYLLRFGENYLLLEQLNKLFYVIPRTNKLVTLDLPELTPRETILNTDFKFKSASAWCKLPSGEIFLCGGVRQHKGATYYKEAVLIDPSTKQLKQLPAMKTTRCRHAVAHYRDAIYVFGGYNEALLKSCEKFDIMENSWSALPDLKEGKDCMSVSIWRDRAYLVGYGSNRVEVFDFVTGNIFALPAAFRASVMNMLMPKHCAIVGIEGGEMVIVMESEILRVNVDSQTVRSVSLPSKLERAWYTQCAPVVLKGAEILFFTLDQELWRLTLSTSDLKLILTVK